MAPRKQQDESGNEYHSLRVIDAAALLINVYRGARSSKVGFEDAERTLAMLAQELGAKDTIRMKRDALESALWSCNMLFEQGKFWHPKKISFDSFLGELLHKNQDFDKMYNFIKEKKRVSNSRRAKSPGSSSDSGDGSGGSPDQG